MRIIRILMYPGVQHGLYLISYSLSSSYPSLTDTVQKQTITIEVPEGSTCALEVCSLNSETRLSHIYYSIYLHHWNVLIGVLLSSASSRKRRATTPAPERSATSHRDGSGSTTSPRRKAITNVRAAPLCFTRGRFLSYARLLFD